MPNGCEASGSGSVCTTPAARVDDADRGGGLLLTHSLPSAAAAMLRGAAPTVISASRTRARFEGAHRIVVLVDDHSRAKPPGEALHSTDVDALGRRAVSGRCTGCRKVFVRSAPLLSFTLSVT